MSLGHSSNACRLRAASKECFHPLMFPEVCCSESMGAGLKGKEFWNLLSSCGGAGGAPRAHCLIQCPLSSVCPHTFCLEERERGNFWWERGSLRHLPEALGPPGGPAPSHLIFKAHSLAAWGGGRPWSGP